MAEKNANLIRMNITLSAEVHQYYKERSAATGVSMSSLMFLDLEQSIIEREINASKILGSWENRMKFLEDTEGES